MIRVQDVVLGIRSRIGDTDDSRYHYAPMEIIDAINTALEEMSDTLLCFTRTWLVPCQDGVYRYSLPADFLRPISVRYNGTLIEEIRSMEHLSNKPESSLPHGLIVAYDLQTLHLFNLDNISSDDMLELYYNNHENINDETDTIALPATAKRAIIYHALGELYDNPVRKNGTEKSNRFRQLYLSEIAKVKNRLYGNRQSKRVCSAHITV